MKIIISPAKRMRTDIDTVGFVGMPEFMKKAEVVLHYLQNMSYDELNRLWKCNDKIAKENADRIRSINLCQNLTPAILAYDGIAYQYMAPAVFEDDHFDYIQKNLRII